MNPSTPNIDRNLGSYINSTNATSSATNNYYNFTLYGSYTGDL